jgi:hypothetical protein
MLSFRAIAGDALRGMAEDARRSGARIRYRRYAPRVPGFFAVPQNVRQNRFERSMGTFPEEL